MYHDSRSSACRFPQGAVKTGSVVTLRLLAAEKILQARLRVWDGKEAVFLPMHRVGKDVLEVQLQTPASGGLLWYDFRTVLEDGREAAYGNAQDELGGVGCEQDCPPAYQITVYDAAWKTPEYLRQGVMYQIFPDRFYASAKPSSPRTEIYLHEKWDETPILMPEKGCDNVARDYFGGDLKGIEEKLPYLSDLGVTVIYLNPIFLARSNHRYDTGDYNAIDPLLGDLDDFTHLCRTAKEVYGIHIMLDGVFSHTGDDSLYFNKYGRYPTLGAYQSRDSVFAPWYTFQKFPDEYTSWWGFKSLPTVNKMDPGYVTYICGQDGIARKWLRRGACGWRLDVADELPMEFLRFLKRAVQHEDEDAVLLGEVWEDASHKVAWGQTRCYCTGDTLDSVMNYPLRDAVIRFLTFEITAQALSRVILSQQENYPAPFYYSLMNLTGSHDRARTINTLAGKTFEDMAVSQRAKASLTKEEYALGKKRYLNMLRLLCALPGIPCVYYGDEAGLYGGSDPYCRGTYPWGKEDKALIGAVRELLHARRKSPALQTGTLSLLTPDSDTLVIMRDITGGKDVFGQSAPDENQVVTVCRR